MRPLPSPPSDDIRLRGRFINRGKTKVSGERSELKRTIHASDEPQASIKSPLINGVLASASIRLTPTNGSTGLVVRPMKKETRDEMIDTLTKAGLFE